MTTLEKIYEQLRKDGKVINQTEFAQRTKMHTTPMSQMLNGKKPLPYKFLVRLYHAFNININFIISNGEGNIYRNDLDNIILEDGETPYDFMNKYKTTQKDLQVLEAQIRDKDKIINLLEQKQGK